MKKKRASRLAPVLLAIPMMIAALTALIIALTLLQPYLQAGIKVAVVP